MAGRRNKSSIYDELQALKTSLPKNSQELIPVLMQLFADFHEKIVAEMTAKFSDKISSNKKAYDDAIKAKDKENASLKSTCKELEDRCQHLEDKLDASEAYSRKDSIIISGDVPAATVDENLKKITVELLNSKLPNSKVELQDISICHRLQTKVPPPGKTANPPNIYVKLVRRDVKQALVLSSKKQPRETIKKIYVNESLTAARSKVLHTLVDLKKKHPSIKGVTSMDGDIYAYTARPNASAEKSSNDRRGLPDLRHRINNQRELQKFCDVHLCRTLESLLEDSRDA